MIHGPGEPHWCTLYDDDDEPVGETCRCSLGEDHDEDELPAGTREAEFVRYLAGDGDGP